nr:unnamed protein product [Callosobruchus analis]
MSRAAESVCNSFRYIEENIIEDILYSQSLTAGTTSEDIFNSISNFVEKSIWIGISSWRTCNDRCTWLVHIVFALASKTLPQKLRQTLDSAIKIVNHIKSRALNSRLLTLITLRRSRF